MSNIGKLLTSNKWMQLRYRTLDCNHHGPSHETLRRTAQIVRMGSYAKMWTLYVYRGNGRTHCFEVCFPQWRGPWPESAGNEPIRPVWWKGE